MTLFYPIPKEDTHLCVSFKKSNWGLQPLCASGGFCTDRYGDCPTKLVRKKKAGATK